VQGENVASSGKEPPDQMEECGVRGAPVAIAGGVVVGRTEQFSGEMAPGVRQAPAGAKGEKIVGHGGI